MYDEEIKLIKSLWYNLTFDRYKEYVEKNYKNAYEDVAYDMQQFKSEILDNLLIILSQFEDIKEIREVYDKIKKLQHIIEEYEEYEKSLAREYSEMKEEEEAIRRNNGFYDYD